MPPLRISGATGESASSVNGTYMPTGKAYNGRMLLRQQEDPDMWLRYVTYDGLNTWIVSTTSSKDANVDVGVCFCVEKNLLHPTEAGTWKVAIGGVLVVQDTVVVEAI